MLNPKNSIATRWTTFADYVQQAQPTVSEQQMLLNSVITTQDPTEDTAAENFTWSQTSQQGLLDTMLQYQSVSTDFEAYLLLGNYTYNGTPLPIKIGCTVAMAALDTFEAGLATPPKPSASGTPITYGNIYLMANSGKGWQAAKKLGQSVATPGGIAMVEFNSKLYMAFTGPAQSLNIWSSSNGGNWGNQIPLIYTSLGAPALAVVGNQLYLAFTGTNNTVYLCQSANGIQFSAPTVCGGLTSDFAPTLAAFNGCLYLAVYTQDHWLNVYFAETSDLANFSSASNTSLPWKSCCQLINGLTTGPALAVFSISGSEVLYLAYTTPSTGSAGSGIALSFTSSWFDFSDPNPVTGIQMNGNLSMAATGGTNTLAYVSKGAVNLTTTTDGVKFSTSATSAQGTQPALGQLGANTYLAFTQPVATTQSS